MEAQKSPLCDIVIPVWNQAAITRRCLEAVRAKTRTPYRLILVDNGSAEETRTFLEEALRDFRDPILVRNPENLGYVRAVNQGLSRSRAPFVCLMNNDIVVTEGWLEHLIRFAEGRPEVGLVNCQWNQDSGQPYPADLEDFARTQSRAPGAWEELDHCSGGCLLIKREVIEKIGVLDESYGMGHWEDNDYSRRAQKAGYRCVRLLDLYIWHDVSSSFKQIPRWKDEARKNEQRFYQKWGRPCRILYPVHELIDVRRARFQQILQTTHALARQGCEVHLLVGKGQPSLTEEFLPYYGLWEHQNLKVHEVPMLRPGPNRRVRLSWDGVFHWASFLKIRALLRKRAFHGIFTRHLNSAGFFASLKKFLPLPLIYEAHEIFFLTAQQEEKKDRIRAREQRTYERMDAIVTNTRAVGESLRRIFSLGIPIENIPNGVHPSFFQRGERIVRPGKIIYVGQLYPWKGVGTLIAAMAHLPEGELHVVGGGREQVEALRGEARRSGVAERIVFHGQVSPAEVRELLGDAAVAVHPLTQKYPDGQFTSPLKLFEYMGAGVPIVAADLPATREILADEVNALLAPPDEPAALGAKIRRLLNDPDLRGRISRKAADDVLSFTWERRAERLLALFAKLGEPKGSKND